MAKKNNDSVIALEIEKYEQKINEFQTYLETHDIRRIGEFDGEEDKYKEIDTQIKMMNALPNWLVSLKALKEAAEEAKTELRGGNEISDAARIMMERNKQ